MQATGILDSLIFQQMEGTTKAKEIVKCLACSDNGKICTLYLFAGKSTILSGYQEKISSFSDVSLPPGNKVWGKVLFSQAFVYPQGDLCMMSLPVWLPGPIYLLGVSVPGPMFFLGGLCLGSLCPGGLSPGVSLSGGVSVGRLPSGIRKVGGMHPTRMFSCFKLY